MSDRAIRSLENLQKSASTARVLNLLKVADDYEHTDDWREKPMFQTPWLNKALIIKHRLRRNETYMFHGQRHVATKVIIPIDRSDLKTGGRYFFINQINFETSVREAFGLQPNHPDVQTLRLIDELPSLDPFLLREQLRKNNIDAAPCYYGLSDADLEKMLAFVQAEIEPLVALSFGGVSASRSTERMAAKILSNSSEDRMEALGNTLRLAPEQYQEGVFSWKGFLYYKWTLDRMMGDVGKVADEIATVKAYGPSDQQASEYIARGRAVLRKHIISTCNEVSQTLKVYDEAYAGLTQQGDPLGFRDFLLEAPAMFSRLGEQLGVIQHIVSFWRFRFGANAAPVTVEELIDIFMDFETGLMAAGPDAPDPRDLMAA